MLTASNATASKLSAAADGFIGVKSPVQVDVMR